MKIALLIAFLLVVVGMVVLIVRQRPRPLTQNGGLTVKILLHTEPFQFTGVDLFTIMGSRMDQLPQIPFSTGPIVTRETVLPKDQLVNLHGQVADEIHIFNPPGGSDGSFTTRKFLFRDGSLIGITMGIDSVYLDRLIQEVTRR